MNNTHKEACHEQAHSALLLSVIYCASVVVTLMMAIIQPIVVTLRHSCYVPMLSGVGGLYPYEGYYYVFAAGFLIMYYGSTWLSFQGLKGNGEYSDRVGISTGFRAVCTACGCGFIIGLLTLGVAGILLEVVGVWPGRWALHDELESGTPALQGQLILWSSAILSAVAVFAVSPKVKARHVRGFVKGVAVLSIAMFVISLALFVLTKANLCIGPITGLFCAWCAYWWAFRARSFGYSRKGK